MKSSINNRLVNIYVTVPDFQIKTAIRIGANPSLILDGGPLAAEVGEGYKIACSAF